MNSFRIQKISAALAACGLLTTLNSMAAPLSLAQAPAGSITVVPPPPNLILTFDNSNSMNFSQDTPPFSRMQSLRQALLAAFTAANVPDNSIRLGWNTINPLDWNGGWNWGMGNLRDCTEFRTTGPACGPQGNILRPLTPQHRANFLQWVSNGSDNGSQNNGLQGFGNTPTLHGYYNALRQYDIPASDANSPWAEVPGTRAGTYHSCRKSYVMLLTDGDYNRIDDAGVRQGGASDLDSTARTLGDGVTGYDPRQPYANIYRQTQSSNFNWTNHLEQNLFFSGFNTLSDLAFHYWAKDIDGNSSNNNVKPMFRVTATENGIDKFWNPKNDPATWQHVSTYTIGYGSTASGWPTSPRLTGAETLYGSADLQRLMSGTLSWPRQDLSTTMIQQEMMHAAINGRGKFYPARTGQDVTAAIQDMLTDVIPVAEQHVTSAAGSTLSASVQSSAFYTSYDSKDWSGDVSAVTLKVGGGVNGSSAPWGAGQTAASILNSKTPSTRNILTAQMSLGGGGPTWTGKTFQWANLSSDQQTALRGTATVNASTTAVGSGRLDYLRGVRTGEGTTYRQRSSVLGDIVNSNVWYMTGVPNSNYNAPDYLAYVRSQKVASRKSALFVGANDGMLHAFDASNGQELFAYVPLGSYANLASLTTAPYAHKYFVDGSPFTADYCKSYSGGSNPTCTAWGSMLVGFMGAGGKGYFMLDVSDPASVLASSVVLDTTSGYLPGQLTADPDIGYITQDPVTELSNPLSSRQVARMNNGKWALVTGNGYNSTNEKAVLIVQYLDGSAAKKIYATSVTGDSNGLSAPRLVDLNGDGVPDVAYAGDLKGNLWKFDLSGTNDSSWSVAGGNAMFTAKSASGAVQSITTAPLYQTHPTKGLMVVFGTGQNLTVDDRTTITSQSVYGLYDFGFSLTNYKAGGVSVTSAAKSDKTSWSPSTGTRSTAMLSQSIDSSTGKSTSNYDVASLGFDAIGSTYRGWYADLPVQRERVLRNPKWFDGDLIDLVSDVPASAATSDDPCQAVTTSSALYYTTVFNAVTGNAPSKSIWADPSDPANIINRKEGDLATVETRTDKQSISTCVGPDCKDNEGKPRNLLGRYFKTPSWRQLQ